MLLLPFACFGLASTLLGGMSGLICACRLCRRGIVLFYDRLGERFLLLLLFSFHDRCSYDFWSVVDFFSLVLVGRVYLVGNLFFIDAVALATFVLALFGGNLLLRSGNGLFVEDAVDEVLTLE